VEKLVGLFEPFILHNEHDFVADNVEKLSQALTPKKKKSSAMTQRASIGGSIGSNPYTGLAAMDVSAD